MRVPSFRAMLPWLIGLSIAASLACLALAVLLGFAAGSDARDRAARQMAVLAENIVRQIDSDMVQYDLVLTETARLLPAPGDGGPAAAKSTFLELPLTARYAFFINVLNESGDVIADPRTNVPRPANFAGRDYFKYHRKNPADVLLIGSPFSITPPGPDASVTFSRRLNRTDGGFAGVVVVGIRLTWLSDLLAQPTPDAHPTITIRREDGVILMRNPSDPDAIGHFGAPDPAWQTYLRTGLPPADDSYLFRQVGASGLVLELTLDRAEIAAHEPAWPAWLPGLPLLPGLCVIGLGLAAHGLGRRVDRSDAAGRIAVEEGSRMLTTMNHELRTPLAGILGQAELLSLEGGLNARQTSQVKQLTDAGELMRAIINRNIDFGRSDELFEKPAARPTDIHELIRSCLGMVEPEARRKGLHLSSMVDPATPARIMLPPDHVRQVLANLLQNAVKYTTEGTVELQVRGDPARLWIDVADTGRGIPPGKRHRLFRAYDRLDTLDPRTGGTGLGLTISERLVKAMGGTLDHRDNPRGGSIFRVVLPIAEAGPLDASDIAHAQPIPETPPLRILLADDRKESRVVAFEFLRAAGHMVTEVTGGGAAIAELQARHYDLLLTDMRMPDVDGLELTRRVRALPGYRSRTPIVLVSADESALRAGESGRIGVDVCLLKPFNRPGLLAAVARAAALAPVPDNDASVGSVLDEGAQDKLKFSLGDDAFTAHVEAVMRRIEDLLAMLETPGAPENRTVREAAHDLSGVAGLTGLNALGYGLRWFDTAQERAASAAALHEAATATLRALRERLATEPPTRTPDGPRPLSSAPGEAGNSPTAAA